MVRSSQRSRPAPALFSLAAIAAGLPQAGGTGIPGDHCPGSIEVHGFHSVSLVPARWNTPGHHGALVEIVRANSTGKHVTEERYLRGQYAFNKVVPHLGGRTYFGETCTPGMYNNSEYIALNLLGKTLRYTLNVSGAGCGCNAALYLTSMKQNQERGDCEDYYCDSSSICGSECPEIDIQAANEVAWHSDLLGIDGGYGGGLNWDGPRDWGYKDYAPGSKCIDTRYPFEVAVSFPVGRLGGLYAMEVKLTQTKQDGRPPCSVGSKIKTFHKGDALSAALAKGMTPVISYWGSKDMIWMDGRGTDKQGPCGKDLPDLCPNSVQFYGFAVEDIKVPTARPPKPVAPAKPVSPVPTRTPSGTERPATAAVSPAPKAPPPRPTTLAPATLAPTTRAPTLAPTVTRTSTTPTTTPTSTTTTSLTSTSPPPPPSSSAPAAPSLTPSDSRVGWLKVAGNRIVSETTGQPVRLRGMALFWSQWMGQYWNPDVVKWLKDDWHATLVRAAMGVEMDSYLKHPEVEKAKLEAVVQAAISLGIYVIIDWHDYHANLHLNEAMAFFDEMARKYGQFPNVLFETWNEPQQVGWAETIKPYHEQVVRVIRQHSNNIIILGTRSWSQEVEEAAMNPVAGINLAYTIHFYAASMGQDLRNKVSAALARGVPVFATEWGTCEYTGNGQVSIPETQAWLQLFQDNYISDANWGISDKQESCSALMPKASGSGGWAEYQLTQSGQFVRSSLRAAEQHPELMPPVPTSHEPDHPSHSGGHGVAIFAVLASVLGGAILAAVAALVLLKTLSIDSIDKIWPRDGVNNCTGCLQRAALSAQDLLASSRGGGADAEFNYT